MRKNKAFILWIFVFFLSFYILISSGRFGGDGLNNYLTAESIVLDGDFSIHDRSFEVTEMRYSEKEVVSSEVERYSRAGLAVAFLLVPFYFLGNIVASFFGSVPHDYITQFTVSFFNPVVLAILGILLFNLLMKLGYSSKISFLTVLVYSLCTMNVVYARSGFSEPLVSLLVLVGVSKFLDYSRNRSLHSIVIASIAVGYTLFIKKNSFILFPAFGGYFLYLLATDKENYLRDKLTHLIAFAIPVLLAVIAIFIQNKVLYGGLLNTEHGTMGDMVAKFRTDGYPVKGLYYYLISSGKGYFIYNIALVLGLFSIKDFFNKQKDYSVFIAALLLSNIFVYSYIFVRGSLFSWGPRYLFPTLPLLALFLAEFMSKKDSLKRKVTVLFFAILGFFIQLPNLFINFSKYLFFVKEKLGLEEYLINFMPELSPIKGVWTLLCSLISKSLGMESFTFSFNPDLWFFSTISASLEGYDILDICWFNILKVNNSLIVCVLSAVIVLFTLLALSLAKILKYVRND